MEKILCADSKWRMGQSGFYGLLSLCFLTASFRTGSGSWLGCLIFLFLAVERCQGLIPGAAFLKLDQEGFTACYWFRETRYRWCDIAEFKVLTYRYMGIIPYRRMVVFRFTESSGKRNLALRVAGAIARFDRALPDTYGMKAGELALLMDRWKHSSASAHQQGTPWITSSWEAAQPRS